MCKSIFKIYVFGEPAILYRKKNYYVGSNEINDGTEAVFCEGSFFISTDHEPDFLTSNEPLPVLSAVQKDFRM